MAVVASLWGAGLAGAQGPVAQESSALLTTDGAENDVSLFLVPDGSGKLFSECYERGGNEVAAVITVTLRDANGFPVAGVPAEDIRLEQANSTLVWCADSYYPPPNHAPNLADGPTNSAGVTTFTMGYHGGGSVEAMATGGTYVWVREDSGSWHRIPDPLMVSYNSADLNGDLVCNISDLQYFAINFFLEYDYRADFNYDQVIDLLDLVHFSMKYQASCP
jgi:hypothetical protein